MLFCDIKFGTMSNVNVSFLSLCNGKLTINKENKPTYVDGIVKLMPVRKSNTRHSVPGHFSG